MVNFTFKGHKISIRNDDWRKLKERFNVENAEKDEDGDYFINIPCSLCDRHYSPNLLCQKCPLIKMGKGYSFRCVVLIYSILRKKIIRFGFNDVEWPKKDNTQARRQLKAVLRRMEKIEASQ